MAEQRIYSAPGVDLQALAQALLEWYQQQGFESQIVPSAGGGLTVQARKEDTLRKVSGTSAALSVNLIRQGDNLTVQAGAAKWADKAVVGVAAAIIFWPLLILPAYGAYKQKDLIDDTFVFIDQYLGSAGMIAAPTGAPAGAAATTATNLAVHCPSCNQPLREGARFCDKCGSALITECPKCKADLRPGAKFCDACGAPIEAK